MRDLFLPFRLRTYAVFDVIWEQRTDVKSQYKGECAGCAKQFPAKEKRSMFVLVPEGTERKRKPFIVVCSCPDCLAKVRSSIETAFKTLSDGTRAFYVYEVERVLREAKLKFVTSD